MYIYIIYMCQGGKTLRRLVFPSPAPAFPEAKSMVDRATKKVLMQKEEEEKEEEGGICYDTCWCHMMTSIA